MVVCESLERETQAQHTLSWEFQKENSDGHRTTYTTKFQGALLLSCLFSHMRTYVPLTTPGCNDIFRELSHTQDPPNTLVFP